MKNQAKITAKKVQPRRIGKWAATEWSHKIRISEEGEAGFTPIADVLPIHADEVITYEDRYHARIMAAAPTMLAALKLTQERIQQIANSSRELSNAEVFSILYGKNEINTALELSNYSTNF